MTQPSHDAEPTTRRVLMGIPSAGAHGGGPALHLPMLVDDLRARGDVEVETFAYGRWGEGEALVTKMRHQLVDVVRFPGRVRRTAPDLVHLNTAFDRKAIGRDVAFALAARRARVPLLLKWHGSETHWLRTRHPLWRALVRTLLSNIQAIAVLSTEEQRDLHDAGFHKPVYVVKNGLDLERYRPRGDVRPSLGLPGDAVVFLFIARLIRSKGLDDAVRAMGLVDDARAHLVVVGDGPARAEAERLSRALDLDSRVHFVGAVREDEATAFYRGCDVLVLPTRHAEGFPMSVFQAVASGMAIVTTRMRAAADHLCEPENVLFVPPRDARAVAHALQRLLDERGLLEAMRRNNLELATRFARQTVADEFADVYRELQRSAQRGVANVAAGKI